MHVAPEGFQFAKQHGRGNEYTDRLFRAFFQEEQDIGDVDVLTKLAGEAGLDREEYRQALDSRRYRDAHRAALRHAVEDMGISSVPTFLIGGKVLEGLPSRETFVRAIEAAEGEA
jgi:predicted DsbA family dithiol-disulfide isomerase